MVSLDEIIARLGQKGVVEGRKAHYELSPLPLGMRALHHEKSKDYRVGAVVILLYNREGKPHFVVTQRQEYEGAHSGQISFPGGKFEAKDVTTEQTALRETKEEIGVSGIEIVRNLSELYIPPSNFLVFPYVGVVRGNVVFERDEFEVKEIVEVAVADLLAVEITQKQLRDLVKTPQYELECPCFELGGKVIWGATAMMLNELRCLLLD